MGLAVFPVVSPLFSAGFRAQFNGLKDLIDDVPADPPGPPGELTTQQLNNAIAGTSTHTNAVATRDTPFADPDLEAMRQKMNETLLAAWR